MPRQKILMAIVILLVSVNIATLALLWAQHRKENRPARDVNPKDFVIKAVGMTTAQQILYDSLRNSHHRQIQMLNQEDRQLHDQLFKNISKAELDSIKVDSIAHRIALLDVKKQKITVYHFRELRQMLTIDQRPKFDKVLAEVLELIGRQRPLQKHSSPPPFRQGGRPEDGPPPGDVPPSN